VLEDMPEVSAAAAAMHLGACHEIALVGRGADRVRQRLIETRPAGTALEFRVRGEQRQIAARAGEDAFALLVVERARARALGAAAAQTVVLRRREDAAPLLVALLDLEWAGHRIVRLAPAPRDERRDGAGCGEQDRASFHHHDSFLPQSCSSR